MISYEQFKKDCDANPALTRQQVGERAGLGRGQIVAFAARLAVERGEVRPEEHGPH